MDTRMITALYERLSRDDDLEGESNSISNQKRQLEDYARSQGFPNSVHFTDDGISGTCFDRPGFLAMMKEVEAGRVEYLLIKDMSRLGRDYLKVGQIMEILRQKGVRLIAINDGVDSARGDDDFTPFRNIMNEYYARDTSRKIRSTFQSKGKSGKHVTGTVIYGYLWNEARDQWLVDEYAAGIVKRIFAMTIEGMGPYQIANRLKEEKVLIPSAYLATHNEGVNKNKTFKVYFTFKCPTYAEHGSRGCSDIKMRKSDLDLAVLSFIKSQMDVFIDMENTLRRLLAMKKAKLKQNNTQQEIKALRQKLASKQSLLSGLYVDLKEGMLSQDEYGHHREIITADIKALETNLAELENAKNETEEQITGEMKWKFMIQRFYDATEMTAEMADAFIESMKLHEDGSLEIKLS